MDCENVRNSKVLLSTNLQFTIFTQNAVAHYSNSQFAIFDVASGHEVDRIDAK